MHLRMLKKLGYPCLHNMAQSVQVKNTHSAMIWLEAKLVVCCGLLILARFSHV